jgi:predicted nucleic acid-binding protein
MRDRIFIDTNVWVYLFLQDDDEKYKTVERFLSDNNRKAIFFITYQIINEVSNTMLRYKYSENQIREYIGFLYRICTIQNFNKEIILNASSIRERYSFSFWDSILIGSALFAECNMLVSEDMQNGLTVDKSLLIRNIFK